MVFSLFLNTHLEVAFSQVSDSATRRRLDGVMAIWLVPLFALRFIASPLSYTFCLAQRQKVDLIWQSVLLGMVIVVLYGFDSYRLTLIAYGAGYAGMYVVYLMLSSRYGGRQTAGAGA